MCKYLQNAPKTLANRREAPSCMPWLIAIVVSVFCCNWNCNSFVSIFPAHTHTHERRHTHASRLCSVIYAFRCIVVVAVVTVTTASVFSSYTHTLTRTVGFFLLLLCCHFCCRDIVSNIVVAIVRQHQDCSLPLLRAQTKELHYLCLHVCTNVYDRFHNIFMFFISSNPKYFINMVDYSADFP